MKRVSILFILAVLTLSLRAQTPVNEISTPEFFELANVAYSITPFGRANENLANRETVYYQEVIRRFGKFETHPLIKYLDAELTKSYSSYVANRSYSVNFEFSGERIVERDVVSPLTRIQANVIGNHFKELSLWEDFAKVSGFRHFYAENRKFYDESLGLVRENLPVDKIQQWLEARFDERYDRYHIFTSPLIGGTHSTNRANVNGVNKCWMFVSDTGGFDRKKLSPKLIEARYTGVVFTEIDHNYNNPVTQKLTASISKAMPDTKKWSDGTEARGGFYKTPVKIFDEYATHSLFLLYVYDTFGRDIYDAVAAGKIKQMENGRGFVRFGAFHQEFLRVYVARPKDSKVSELYPAMIEWIAQN